MPSARGVGCPTDLGVVPEVAGEQLRDVAAVRHTQLVGAAEETLDVDERVVCPRQLTARLDVLVGEQVGATQAPLVSLRGRQTSG